MIRLPLPRLLSWLLVLAVLVGANTHAAEQSAYELTALRNFNKAIILLKANYPEPERIKPREMMIAALESVEKKVPDVIVNGDAGTSKLTVTAGHQTQTFDISTINSLWKMSFAMKDVFDFISKNVRPLQEPWRVEDAAINGMLSTLDRHSVLVRPEPDSKNEQPAKDTEFDPGLVLQLKDDRLTVLRVRRRTPASEEGLAWGDQLTKIGDEPTADMGLEEAGSKLKGPEGSTVQITVERKGWAKPRELTLTRAQSVISSVQHKLLAGKVGYLRLENFSEGAFEQLQAALDMLSDEAGPTGLKGLVLDLRVNPGGLFQEAIKVSDLFLSRGSIVTSVAASSQERVVISAHAGAGDITYPMAVLVGPASASAAEITAGALKHLDRAVLIGRRTFGKGSQQVRWDLPDGAALKLTMAHYLAPGDISWEDTGILPDIELEPTRVSQKRVSLFAPLEASGTKARGKQAGRLQYLETREPEEVDPWSLETLEEDFQIAFARDFVLRAPAAERGEMMRRGKDYVEQKQREEQERIHQAITALGVDWSPGPTPKTPSLAITLKPGVGQKLVAGEKVDLEVTVENQGEEPVHRLRAWTESPDNRGLHGREFLLGAVKPGERKSWKVPVTLPMNLPSQRDRVTVRLQDDSGMLQPSATAELNLVEHPRPAFAFSWQVQDGCDTCNGDGLLEAGETVNVLVDITNTGAGKATHVSAWLQDSVPEGVTLEDDFTRLGQLAPRETKTARFQVKVIDGYLLKTTELKLSIFDEKQEEGSTEKLILPVRQEAPEVKQAPAVVRLGKKAALLAAPEEEARPLGKLRKDVVVRQVAQVDGFAKVMLDEKRFAFVKAQDAKRGARLKPAPVTAKVLELTPAPTPQRISLSLDGVRPAEGGRVTSEERFTLSGTAAFPRAGPARLYVLVNGEKVFFQLRPGAEEAPAPVAFTTNFALKEGINQVVVVAAAADEDPDASAQETVLIRRTPATPLAR